MANVSFNIYNRLNQEVKPASGYSLSFDKFTFIANFNGTSNSISNKKVLWNYGDGTTSSALTSYHSYSLPGYYPVTLTIYDSAGNGSLAPYLSVIKIYNAVDDKILLTTDNNLFLRSGQANGAIYLTRFNSAQTSVSGTNTVISLGVSGNRSPFFDSTTYNTDKYAHLKSSAKFAINTDLGLTIVDAVTTTNDALYAIPSSSDTTISLTTSSYSSTYLAGSSGQATFYYVEDFKL